MFFGKKKTWKVMEDYEGKYLVDEQDNNDH